MVCGFRGLCGPVFGSCEQIVCVDSLKTWIEWVGVGLDGLGFGVLGLGWFGVDGV